jgi:hypothetical protein
LFLLLLLPGLGSSSKKWAVRPSVRVRRTCSACFPRIHCFRSTYILLFVLFFLYFLTSLYAGPNCPRKSPKLPPEVPFFAPGSPLNCPRKSPLEESYSRRSVDCCTARCGPPMPPEVPTLQNGLCPLLTIRYAFTRPRKSPTAFGCLSLPPANNDLLLAFPPIIPWTVPRH